MDSRSHACPTCGSDDAESVEAMWDAGPKNRDSPIAPPVPRDAETNLGRFYGWGVFWLTVTVVVIFVLRNVTSARVESVLEVTLLVGFLGVLQIVRLLTRRPQPTEDQEAAMAEWHAAHAEWERKRVCRSCGTVFAPPSPDVS